MKPQLQAVPALTRRAVLYVRVSTKEQLQGNGDPDGYSIPAQRQFCQAKAEDLGAEVVEVFIERGESARSADRPELQRMLLSLASTPVDYVIVHKVDRLARNRMDDVTITAQIQAAGAQLVSVTENIDETPSGLLMHGIMSSIAEFYSRNLAAEVVKGTQQKVSAGGTPHVAPLGYLNVRQVVDGRESRTVAVDPERAPLMRWAFESYATGDWSLKSLAVELEARGLTQRASAQRVARPVAANKLHEMLRNRYYLGYVTWRGVEHDGNHPPLIDAETFEQVQRVLAAHRLSGERSSKHQHYLAGTIACGRCQSRLLYGVTTGRRGDQYEYFFCAGRHSKRKPCRLPYLPVDQVEHAVERQWQDEQLSQAFTDELRQALLRNGERHATETKSERDRLTERVHAIRRERYKWAEKAMDGVVPSDIAREKQQQLGDQLLSSEAALLRLQEFRADQLDLMNRLLDLVTNCAAAYARSSSKGRRDYNQAWFEALELDVADDDQVRVRDVRRTAVLAALPRAAQPDLADVLDQEQQRRQGGGPDGVECVGVSNYVLLVELRGFEPLTPSMRTRCATRLRHSPANGWNATSRLRPGAARGSRRARARSRRSRGRARPRRHRRRPRAGAGRPPCWGPSGR